MFFISFQENNSGLIGDGLSYKYDKIYIVYVHLHLKYSEKD